MRTPTTKLTQASIHAKETSMESLVPNGCQLLAEEYRTGNSAASVARSPSCGTTRGHRTMNAVVLHMQSDAAADGVDPFVREWMKQSQMITAKFKRYILEKERR